MTPLARIKELEKQVAEIRELLENPERLVTEEVIDRINLELDARLIRRIAEAEHQ